MQQNTGFSIINLRESGEVRLLFPDEIETDDRTNWEAADIIGRLKPLSFGNVEPQQTTINDLCLDHSRTGASIEPHIQTLRSWMRPNSTNGSPPPLQIVTAGWQKRGVLSGLRVRRNFWTKDGVCIRAYLSLTFDELPGANGAAPQNTLQIEPTTRRRSGNSISGRT